MKNSQRRKTVRGTVLCAGGRRCPSGLHSPSLPGILIFDKKGPPGRQHGLACQARKSEERITVGRGPRQRVATPLAKSRRSLKRPPHLHLSVVTADGGAVTQRLTVSRPSVRLFQRQPKTLQLLSGSQAQNDEQNVRHPDRLHANWNESNASEQKCEKH